MPLGPGSITRICSAILPEAGSVVASKTLIVSPVVGGAWWHRQGVLHGLIDRLDQNRARRQPRLDGKFSLAVGSHRGEGLHSGSTGLDQSDQHGGLRLSSGLIDDCAVDGRECARQRSKKPDEDLHAIAFPHSPQNFIEFGNLAPQCGQTLGSGTAFTFATAGGTLWGPAILSISASTPASSFCKVNLVC